MHNFQGALKKYREERHLTLRDLAEVLKLTPNTLVNYEKGRSFPTIQDVEKMAKYFNVSLTDMLGIDPSLDREGELLQMLREKDDMIKTLLEMVKDKK